MNKITVIDGDTVMQLYRNLNSDLRLSPNMDIKAFKYNRFAVYKTHLDFLRAGARIIKTNTSRVTTSSIQEHLGIIGPEATSFFATAVELAQKAVFKYYEETGGDTSNVEEFKRNGPQVAGCCSGYATSNLQNKNEDYWNYVSSDCVKRWHRLRIQALINAGVDLLALDDVSCQMEAEVFMDLLRQFRTARAWITFLCKSDTELLDGSDFVKVATRFYHSLPGQIIAIGFCCSDLDQGLLLLENIYAQTLNNPIPLLVDIAYFNDDSSLVVDTSEALEYYVQRWMSYGVSYISGNYSVCADDTKIISNIVKTLQHSGASSATTRSSRSEENKSKLS
ncbi:PREDICTED: selenocysteine methyltransferase-like [Dinoponera quadriceps]|uniref:Selenocysteine methyltransferase-like n=1 Tax=Dinoponera quadriceps TaxID=609295 RepID=A0A6P3WY47_DINQU|nr:PREDICTED: selenocysteine methyltransferase-like [Dinoponera quadriceps]